MSPADPAGQLSYPLPAPADPDRIFSTFLDALTGAGLTLYPAQEEAILELMAGHHVILGTPTGSGKSLVASALHHKALCEGRRSIYTCPIKALVSEKFFSLCQRFGAERVGMLTGDASINPEAELLCCTAEILANMALCGGARAAIDYVVMDEFHYYADPGRGVAWQLPLLCMPETTFLLMSATLGDCQRIAESLSACTGGRQVAQVRSAQRPVPLDFSWDERLLHESLDELLSSGKAPVYVVHFSQKESVEAAQNLLSVNFCSREQKAKIAAELQGFRFDSPFGKDMRRFVAHGIGLHHAGLLPKYRLLVEKLAQAGHLRVIMGTDTLGVGVNVPIRTVLLTRLYKFHGHGSGLLSVREFHQIAGRAGRQGFDAAGSVVVQAPAHAVDNARQQSRAADNKAKLRKLVKKKPPPGFVPYSEATLQKLIADPPEPLISQFRLSPAALLNVLQAHPRGYAQIVALVTASHSTPAQKTRHLCAAAQNLRLLRQAGIVQVVRHVGRRGARLRIAAELPEQFALTQPLSLFLHDTLPELDPDAPTYALDVLSLCESILESPATVLRKQVDLLRRARLGELKAQGVDYAERQAELDKIEHEKPLGEFIYARFNAYAERHPWVREWPIRPKSIARQMVEGWASFGEYVRELGLQRAEGVLLRYLSDVCRTLQQSVPQLHAHPGLLDLWVFLQTLVRGVDGSLLAEWSQLVQGSDAAPTPGPANKAPVDRRTLRSRARTEAQRLVRALSRGEFEEAAAGQRNPAWDAARFAAALAEFTAQFGALRADPAARQGHHTHIQEKDPARWQLSQALLDAEEQSDWALHADIDVQEDGAEGPLLSVDRLGS